MIKNWLSLDAHPILIYPNPMLRQVAQPIEQINEDIHKVAEIMFKIMYKSNGVGLAATQVGLPYQIIVMNTNKELVFINPKIEYDNSRKTDYPESCLSIQGISALVNRPRKVHLFATTLNGKTSKITYEGLTARVLQHEVDHLNGILFIDRLNEKEKAEALDKLNIKT